MSGSVYGKIFTVSTFGESHGSAIGVIVDGVTPNVELTVEDIQVELDRRRPGQSKYTTMRNEGDKVEILSGIFEGKTTGTPLAMVIRNQDSRSGDYGNIAQIFRPGHADYAYQKKYGIRDYRGGGRSSGRETAARVAAGAVAKKLLSLKGINIKAFVQQIGAVKGTRYEADFVEKNPLRCADPDVVEAMEAMVWQAMSQQDSVGGIVECRINGVAPGIGEPVFDRLDAELAKAALSIGGVKGIEFGRGFECGAMFGSEHNDPIGQDKFRTNNAGGILGGISNGDEIVFRIAVKPTASIAQTQQTVNMEGNEVQINIKGRHDPCLCPRVAVVLESMAALVLIDLIKQQAALLA